MNRNAFLLALLTIVLGGFFVLSPYGLGIWDLDGDRLIQVVPDAAVAGAPVEEDRSEEGEAEGRQGSRVALGADKVSVIQGQVIDELSEPIAGAVVVLRRMPDAGDPSRMGPVVARARSGEDGRFGLGEQGSGRYRLIVRARGWSTSWTQVWIDRASLDAEDMIVQLVAGYGLQGQVVGPDGKGLAGAWILASWPNSGSWIDTWSELRSDAEGRFSFPALPADRVPLLTWVEGFGLGLTEVDASRSDQVRIELDPSSPYKMSFSLAESLEKGPGKPSDVSVMLTLYYHGMDLRLPTPIHYIRVPVEGQIEVTGLRNAEFSISAHSEQRVIRESSREQELDLEHPKAEIELAWEPGLPLKGRLVFKDGRPAPFVSFQVDCENHVGGYEVTSDIEGRFALPSRFHANEEPEAWEPSVGFRFANNVGDMSFVVLKPGEEESLVQVMHTPVIAGRVVDERGRLMAGVGVVLQPASGSVVPRAAGTTNERGEFRFSVRPAKRSVFSVQPIGKERWFLSAVHTTMVSPEPLPLKGNGQSSEGGFVLRLIDGAAAEGTVVDDKGRGIPGVSIEASPYDAEAQGLWREPSWSHSVRQSVPSNREGRFRILGLRPGAWRIRAVTHGFLLRGSSPVLQIKAGETRRELRFVMDRGLTIRGRILTDAGKPMGGMEIQASYAGDLGESEPGASSHTVSKSDGSFVLENLRAGDYALAATLPEGPIKRLGLDKLGPNSWPSMWPADTSFKAHVPAGSQDYGWKIRLPRFGSIRIRLAWSGEPLSEVDVELHSKDTLWSYEMPVVRGLLVMKRVLAGSYDIRFRTSKYADVARKVSVRRDKESDLGILRLMDAPRVKGRVVDADGKPLAGVRISVDPDVARSWTSCEIEQGEMKLAGDVLTQSDAQGRFEVVLHRPAKIYGYKLGYAPRSIASGEVVLLVLPKAGRIRVTTPPLAAGEDWSLWSIQLTRMTTTDKPGAKESGAAWSRSLREDASVTTHFRGLLPGRYILRAANNAKLSGFQKKTLAGESYYEEILIQAGSNRLIKIP